MKVDMTIYRFMSFESFVDMIQRKSLTFVHYEKWEDPYDGFILRAMKNKDGIKQILDSLKRLTPELAIPNWGFLLKSNNIMFGQSWTQCEESDALWRIYSNNKMAIRIEVLGFDIFKLKEDYSITPHEIVYSDSISIESQLEQIVDNDKINLDKLLLTKRTAFEHEQEVRLLKIDFDYFQDDSRNFDPGVLKVLYKNGDITKEQYDTGIQSINRIVKVPNVVYIPFSHINNFIRSVMLHPQAPNWFSDTVSKFCANNDLNYLGKSKLYQFSLDSC